MFAPNQFLLSRDGDVAVNLSVRAEETRNGLEKVSYQQILKDLLPKV